MTLSKDARIYIAGHNGLVGSAIYSSLKRQGFTTLITASKSELDLCNQQAVLDFFQEKQPEYVILDLIEINHQLGSCDCISTNNRSTWCYMPSI